MVYQLFYYIKNFLNTTKKDEKDLNYFLNENIKRIEKNIEYNKEYKFKCSKEDRHILYKKFKGRNNVSIFSEGQYENKNIFIKYSY